MGPLVPYLISDQLNLIVALVLGFGFGFVLEQAGFSSSRKLAGVFYGYDFTVLRVFFTAATTAMSGVILLGYLGLLDTEAIFINPTWLWPSVVGGIIMGLGFVLGGYCPGTSICAAAIGKVDAIFFVGGGLLGVLLFGEFFPAYDEFYQSSALGPIKVFDSLGLPMGWFAFILIAVAVSAFAVTTWIERRTNPDAPSRHFRLSSHRFGAAALLVVGIVLIFTTDRKAHLIAQVSDPDYLATHAVKTIAIDDLAFRLMDQESNMQILDVRTAEDYSRLALPRSSNAQLRDFFSRDWSYLLAKRHQKKVLIAEDEASARSAYLLLDKLGYENLAVLEGGLAKFRTTILDPTEYTSTGSRWDEDVKQFRESARLEINRMIEASKNSAPKPQKAKKKVAGGC